MGETSGEIKGLIITLVFLGTFFFLSTMIPPQFLTSDENIQNIKLINYPTYFEGIDIQDFAETYVINLTDPNLLEEEEFSFGGWNMRYEDWPQHKLIMIRTHSAWWFFRWDFDYFRWCDKEGIEQSKSVWIGEIHEKIAITYEALDEAYQKFGTDGLRWTLKNSRTAMIVYIGFNQTKYSKPSDALNGGELSLLLCMNFDKINTTYNAWGLIGALLTFQAPNIHPAINFLIAIPIWILIAYLIYVLILKAIPFVGG